MTTWRATGWLIVTLIVLSALPVAAQEPRAGGILKAAMIGEPPTLDTHTNGKELLASDAAASLARWGRLHTTGKTMFKTIEAVEAKDPHTLVIHLKEPSGSLLYALASPYLAIHPKSVMDAAGDQPVKECVGTGPFRFVEHKPDRHIKLARYKEYAARTEARDGHGGKRTAWVDEIRFMPVPDVAVRVAGVESGEYHFAQRLKPDQHDRLKANTKVDLAIVKPAAWITAAPNHKQGLMTNRKIRQALQAALDMEPIMTAALGHKAFSAWTARSTSPSRGSSTRRPASPATT